MRHRIVLCHLISLFMLGGSSLCVGGETAISKKDFDELKAQLAVMQRQMSEMKRLHEQEIKALKEEVRTSRSGTAPAAPNSEDELTNLRRLAQAEAGKKEGQGEQSEETVFKAGGLSLQSLNPEISVVGDAVGLYRHQDGSRKRSDFDFRCLGLHFESYLDPYTKFKAAVPVDENGASLGEAYMTRFGVLDNVNVTLGKFRQQFGVVNRWHKHGLDQFDFPLALREIFGPGGLNQTGVSFDWTMPELWGSSQELTLQVTNGENGRLFSGNLLSTPSTLLHYKNYRDLSKDTYMEWGVTGLLGWNDEWQIEKGSGTDTVYDSRSTRVFGLDFCLRWEPTDRMRYRNVEWRSELYWLNRDLLAPDNSGADTLNAWGAYMYVQSKINRKLDIGVRLDYYEPDQKDYAGIGTGLSPLAYTGNDAYRWQVGPYITWHQSPFVRYRIEYNHVDGQGMDEPEDVVMFQLIFAAGPHKHDRY